LKNVNTINPTNVDIFNNFFFENKTQKKEFRLHKFPVKKGSNNKREMSDQEPKVRRTKLRLPITFSTKRIWGLIQTKNVYLLQAGDKLKSVKLPKTKEFTNFHHKHLFDDTLDNDTAPKVNLQNGIVERSLNAGPGDRWLIRIQPENEEKFVSFIFSLSTMVKFWRPLHNINAKLE
jgi:hypothetical protein